MDAEHNRVESLLSQMAHRTGGVVVVHGTKPVVYEAYGEAPTMKRDRSGGAGNKAGPITIPQFRWGGTRLS